jgi:RNA polymerase sigma factor (sigma-70 family)
MSASNPNDLRLALDVSSSVDASDVDQIYRRHGNWLVAFLRRRFGEQAEDLAQETFARATKSGLSIQDPRKFLVHVAIGMARDQRRREAVRPVLVEEGTATVRANSPADAEEAVLQKQIIQALPPQLRQVFLLRSFTPMTYAQIADHCGVSVKTVEERVTKALALCKVLLRD